MPGRAPAGLVRAGRRRKVRPVRDARQARRGQRGVSDKKRRHRRTELGRRRRPAKRLPGHVQKLRHDGQVRVPVHDTCERPRGAAEANGAHPRRSRVAASRVRNRRLLRQRPMK